MFCRYSDRMLLFQRSDHISFSVRGPVSELRDYQRNGCEMSSLKVPAVQLERDCAEVLREELRRIAINEESKFRPIGEYL